MLRVIWDESDRSPRLLTQDELLEELEQWAACDFAGAPPGPVVVEDLDAQSRPRWRGYYRDPTQLRALLHQLQAERVMARQRSDAGSGSSSGGKP